jgi:hypothetical protein
MFSRPRPNMFSIHATQENLRSELQAPGAILTLKAAVALGSVFLTGTRMEKSAPRTQRRL